MGKSPGRALAPAFDAPAVHLDAGRDDDAIGAEAAAVSQGCSARNRIEGANLPAHKVNARIGLQGAVVHLEGINGAQACQRRIAEGAGPVGRCGSDEDDVDVRRPACEIARGGRAGEAAPENQHPCRRRGSARADGACERAKGRASRRKQPPPGRHQRRSARSAA